MAVHCARARLFPDSKNEGIDGRRLKIFVSEEAHYSFKKAALVLGLGVNNLVRVPVDSHGKMRPESLEALIHQSRRNGDVPLMVAATAGTTVLGAFDDIAAISSVCRSQEIWLHVDGAWGGPALFSKKLRALVRGIESADSVTFDAHKLLGANLTTSFFLTRHQEILFQANDVSGAEYLFHAQETLDRGRLSWQCGRKGEAMSFWAVWKSLGSEGFSAFIDRLLGIREELVAWIESEPRLQLVAKPEYLNICVRILPPDGTIDANWSIRVREQLKEKDLALVNYASNTDGSFLRLILAHPSLTFQDVKQILMWALEAR